MNVLSKFVQVCAGGLQIVHRIRIRRRVRPMRAVGDGGGLEVPPGPLLIAMGMKVPCAKGIVPHFSAGGFLLRELLRETAALG